MTNPLQDPFGDSTGAGGIKAMIPRRPLQSRQQNVIVGEKLTSKSTLNSLKSTRNEQPMLKPILSSSENVANWPLLADLKHTASKDLRQSDSAELYQDDLPSIFRGLADYDDHEDVMVLKRASPVYDSDDEDYIVAPSKRQRTSGETILQWSSQVVENQTDGFCLTLLQPHD